jgi:drug/metabolite transporter superfamily protein YnfA
MRERERIYASLLGTIMVVLWLGLFFHRSPRFAGTAMGGVLAVSGSLLMLVPLAYMAIKRVRPLRKRVTKHLSMPTLLRIHIYAGIVGPILVLIHTGHKFDSAIGLSLVVMTLIVVASGFVGRYAMSFLGQDVRALRSNLEPLILEHERLVGSRTHASGGRMSKLRMMRARVAGVGLSDAQGALDDWRLLQVSDAIADTEGAIAADKWMKKAFGTWLKVHISLSLVLYGLLATHVASAIYFGLRWFS